MADGIPAGMDGHLLWGIEPPKIPRLCQDVKDRAKRLKCLGNAVVPAQDLQIPPPPPPTKEPPPQAEPHREELPGYDIPDMKPEAAGLGMVEIKAVRDSGDEDDDSPPGR